jgi:hypothetical protein
MDKATRNVLRNVVTKCRRLLEEAIGEILQGQFGIHPNGKVEDLARMQHLSESDRGYREQALIHLQHIQASGLGPAAAVDQLVREIAFTHLNRLVAYKMLEQRKLIREAVSRGIKSNGFLFYLAEQEEDQARWSGGQPDIAYRHYLQWLGGTLSDEIGILFSPDDPANRLFPPQRVLDQVLALINSDELKDIWREDETIGWVYQYFTPKELRESARKKSAAPRNSHEMAFRNQFFTPRFVVEFLVDNTLGRIWYEMREGNTALKEKCRYLATLRTGEVDTPGKIAPRLKKDPREIKVLDPACGSGHFLLYCFDLLQMIYQEAYEDPELGPRLQQEFPDAEAFNLQIPGLILAHNLHGIDIDLRVTQLAALALWLRAQRAFQEMGLKGDDRPPIECMNLACAEPMPGEEDLLEEFIAGLGPHVLGRLIGDLVRKVFARMKLAGEAGALVRIEDDINEPIEEARRQWQKILRRQVARKDELASEGALFDYRKEEAQQHLVFDVADITSESVWENAEAEALQALREYARRAGDGKGLLRRLFASDTEHGFAFIEICRKKFDVVLMNPPFGDASLPSKPYIDETYGDTKGDVYKAFVQCFQDRLVPGGFLGIISSRTGFFLSQSSDWRERIVLRLYRPLVLADFGMGVLDAMVETAAYVLRSLTGEEDKQLTLQLAKDLSQVPTDKKNVFSTKKYETVRGLKRHQANGELRRLYDAGFIKPVEGHFPRWSPLNCEIAKAPAPANAAYPLLVCLRLLGKADKRQTLNESLHDIQGRRRFVVNPQSFQQVPGTPFAYWVSERIRQLFTELLPFGGEEREVRVGLQTSDNFRFVRAWWEVSPEKMLTGTSETTPDDFRKQTFEGKRWAPFAKGGAYSPYYADLHLVVNWERNGEEMKAWAGSLYNNSHWSRIIKNVEFYFRPGLTYTYRTSRFSPQVMPAGSIISVRGSGIYGKDSHAFLGLFASTAFDFLIKILLGRDEHPQFDMGAVNLTPIPSVDSTELLSLKEPAINSFSIKRSIDSVNEISHVFHLPVLLQMNGDTLAQRIAAWQSHIAEADQQLAAHQREIDDIAFQLYGITGEDRRAIESSAAHNPAAPGNGEQPETDDEIDSGQPSTDRRALTNDLLSYAVGCAFGRWDVRVAGGERPSLELPESFAPLPVCAPGALIGQDGLLLGELPPGYPLQVDWDGILVDEADHEDDIISRVRDVFELLLHERAEVMESEACEILGAKTIRDYFRKPGNDGFWMQHVKGYSKGLRKAPIYWLLQSSKKNYALWLYYHRQDKDMLYKVLVNYVEPKIRLEENTLDQVRSRRAAAGTSGREAKQLEKPIDQQEGLLSELRDFRDKLRRAADLRLEPDLNDGVVLNVAPLWEMVPWAEPKKYWQELLEGKYEWSSIGRQLRERGMVKA